ncbi:hypothetical protein HELRODRAFT_179398 [Helobdella robusta]|uniref:Uncharacterized protein n=1 Tax=Helobdella robusta TaxID=6412 RepID=T1FEN3_HELRO|nr:hypothetical protein HELRODRAFT_179398 [Helobdella robusta]ESN95333.1 hypothetical protein HELRODRAFT_179398 [Helobdella robusta]
MNKTPCDVTLNYLRSLRDIEDEYTDDVISNEILSFYTALLMEEGFSCLYNQVFRDATQSDDVSDIYMTSLSLLDTAFNLKFQNYWNFQPSELLNLAKLHLEPLLSIMRLKTIVQSPNYINNNNNNNNYNIISNNNNNNNNNEITNDNESIDRYNTSNIDEDNSDETDISFDSNKILHKTPYLHQMPNDDDNNNKLQSQANKQLNKLHRHYNRDQQQQHQQHHQQHQVHRQLKLNQQNSQQHHLKPHQQQHSNNTLYPSNTQQQHQHQNVEHTDYFPGQNIQLLYKHSKAKRISHYFKCSHGKSVTLKIEKVGGC